MFQHIALVSQSEKVKSWEVQVVAAALQIQVARDFMPIWGVEATVSAFDLLKDVPIGFWPIIVRDDIGIQGLSGVHSDKNKKPYGLVQASNRWSMTASHEVLEMLVDPMGNRLRSAYSLLPDQGLVEFLVEVCDPSEAEEFGYQINGIWLSDFYTPEYFLNRASGNIRYSFTGAIAEPRTILKGGYVTWFDPAADQWWQQTWFDDQGPKSRKIGALNIDTDSPRSLTNADAAQYRSHNTSIFGVPDDHPMIQSQKQLFKQINQANKHQAQKLDSLVAQLRDQALP